MDVCCDCWYSRNKSRGKPPMALQFAQEQNCASKWRCITLDVSSDVDKQSCYYLLRKYKCLLGRMVQDEWTSTCDRRCNGKGYWDILVWEEGLEWSETLREYDTVNAHCAQ